MTRRTLLLILFVELVLAAGGIETPLLLSGAPDSHAVVAVDQGKDFCPIKRSVSVRTVFLLAPESIALFDLAAQATDDDRPLSPNPRPCLAASTLAIHDITSSAQVTGTSPPV
jgi:hypothetical protein